MASYITIAKVDQIVTKEVQLCVKAGSEEEAEAITRRALEDYPKPIKETNVLRVVTNKANYWIPRSIEIVQIREEKDAA